MKNQFRTAAKAIVAMVSVAIVSQQPTHAADLVIENDSPNPAFVALVRAKRGDLVRGADYGGGSGDTSGVSSVTEASYSWRLVAEGYWEVRPYKEVRFEEDRGTHIVAFHVAQNGQPVDWSLPSMRVPTKGGKFESWFGPINGSFGVARQLINRADGASWNIISPAGQRDGWESRSFGVTTGGKFRIR